MVGQNLVNKYKRALEILDREASLKESMRILGIPDRSIFDGWLRAEREYLESLEKEPEEETLQMEYYQKLVNYYANEYVSMLPSFFFPCPYSSQGKGSRIAEGCLRASTARQ